MDKKKILLTIFDVSSDHNFAKVYDVINEKYPSFFDFSVYAGEKMKKRDVTFLGDTVTKSKIGFLESLSSILPSFFFFSRFKKHLKQQKYDLVVCLDGQGFNLIIGKIAKKEGIKTMYYFPPLLFVMPVAKKKLQYFDKILCPFEKNYEYYQKYELPSKYVGHPFSNYRALKKQNHKKKTIGIFPGSRWQEVKKMTPLFLEVVKKIRLDYPEKCQFKIAISHSKYLKTIKKELIKSQLEKDIEIVTEKTDDFISKCYFMICCSGSVTLKASFFHVPHVICYRISKLTYWIAKKFVLIKYIGMLNIFADKEVVPEFINKDAEPKKIYNYIINLLKEETKYNAVKNELISEVKKLEHPDPFGVVADEIYGMFEK